MVIEEVKLFSTVYTHICYQVVIYTMPDEKFRIDGVEDFRLFYPDANLESTSKRYTMDRRNRWMVEESDYVVTYVRKTWGGAYKFKTLAEKQNKTVINLYKEE